MRRQDDEPRVADIDQQHQDEIERGIRARLRVFDALSVSKVQGGLVAMMAVGHVQP